MPDIEAINKTIDRIKQSEASMFIMGTFYDRKWYDDSSALCFTAACIGGWAAVANLPIEEVFNVANYEISGAAILGINNTQAQELFYMLTPSKEEHIALSNCLRRLRFGEVYSAANDFSDVMQEFDQLPDVIRQAIGIYVLEHLRDTGTVSWLAAANRYLAELANTGAPATCGSE